MSKLRLSLACSNYDRTSGLQDGRVRPEGIDLTYLEMPVEETFFRMLRFQEFDVAEMSLSSYAVSLLRPEKPFIAIPIFPSRFFRHSCIYVNAAAGIQEPRDLIGKRVGNPEYQMTAPVWIRGILQDEYGIAPDSVTYYTGGEEEPGRQEKLQLNLPPNIRVQQIGKGETLSVMVREGAIDALYTARMPSSFRSGAGAVKRLFEDYAEVERAYYRKTGIFPIMHTVVIRRPIYERHPWIAMSLFKAFAAAQRRLYEELYDSAALRSMLPWQIKHVEDARSLMGDDFWPYGIEPNRNVLATFLRYHHEQGLSERQIDPEELFAVETTESYKI